MIDNSNLYNGPSRKALVGNVIDRLKNSPKLEIVFKCDGNNSLLLLRLNFTSVNTKAKKQCMERRSVKFCVL